MKNDVTVVVCASSVVPRRTQIIDGREKLWQTNSAMDWAPVSVSARTMP